MKDLRDEIALAALPSIICEIYSWRYTVEGGIPPIAAKLAYEYAEAMMKARKKVDRGEEK
jgi:hypothetical protein